MLNHCRTLLANLPALNDDGAFYLAEELIEPTFRPRPALPAAAAAVRAVLFGTDPDRELINYRLRSLFTLLHASPLAEHVRAFDPRVTYDTGQDARLFSGHLFVPQVRQLSGSEAAPLLYRAATTAPAGRLRRTYTVTTLGAGRVAVTGEGSNSISELTLASGWTPGIALPGSGHEIRLPVLDAGRSWLVTIRTRPAGGPAQLLARLNGLSATALADLFGTATREPDLSWRNLWYQSSSPVLRLGAILLAAVRQLEGGSHGHA